MSWTKEKSLKLIRDVGLIPIVRTPSADDALRAAEAILASGIGIAEITMTVPDALGVMEQVAKKFGDQVLLGAGTIVDAAGCESAISAGAEFIVTPSLEMEVIATAVKRSKPCFPGGSPTAAGEAFARQVDHRVKTAQALQIDKPGNRVPPGFTRSWVARTHKRYNFNPLSPKGRFQGRPNQPVGTGNQYLHSLRNLMANCVRGTAIQKDGKLRLQRGSSASPLSLYQYP